MEPEIIQESIKLKRDYFLPLSILISVLVIAIAWIYTTGKQADHAKVAASLSTSDSKTQVENLEGNIIPTAGVVLPVKWRNLGMEMVEAGVIDAQKFEALYAQRGGLSEEEKNLLYGSTDDNLKITSQNSGFLLIITDLYEVFDIYPEELFISMLVFLYKEPVQFLFVSPVKSFQTF